MLYRRIPIGPLHLLHDVKANKDEEGNVRHVDFHEV